MKNFTYSVRSHVVSTVKKSHANIPCAWARRNSPHDGPPRRGAGPQPARLRTDLIVVAPTRMPSLRSSPWIRMHPQLGFSRPRRTTSSRKRRIERRPTRPAAPVTPLLPHQLTVPAQQRLRRNQEHRPAIPRQQSAGSGKEQPVTPPQRRPLHRPPKHGQLVPEHRVLHLQHGDIPAKTRTNLRLAKNARNTST